MGEAFNIFNLFLQVSDVVNPTTNLPFGNHRLPPSYGDISGGLFLALPHYI